MTPYLPVLRVENIRATFKKMLAKQHFTVDDAGNRTLEILGANFIADEDFIIRPANKDYILRELAWYQSMSLKVDDIPGETPAIWKSIASTHGEINSNYGWCIFSDDNYNQYDKVLAALKENSFTRQASMIYNRPGMHEDSTRDGMRDFMCTYANNFWIRDGKLYSHYIMRSNDSVFGYGNDFAWAKYVQAELVKDLKDTYPNLICGDIIWTASNLHVYERHFPALEEMAKNM